MKGFLEVKEICCPPSALGHSFAKQCARAALLDRASVSPCTWLVAMLGKVLVGLSGGGYSALSKERGEKWALGAAGWDETHSSIT